MLQFWKEIFRQVLLMLQCQLLTHQNVVANRKDGGKHVRLNVLQRQHSNEPADGKQRLEK